jgi:hypothetical protein
VVSLSISTSSGPSSSPSSSALCGTATPPKFRCSIEPRPQRGRHSLDFRHLRPKA